MIMRTDAFWLGPCAGCMSFPCKCRYVPTVTTNNTAWLGGQLTNGDATRIKALEERVATLERLLTRPKRRRATQKKGTGE